MALSTDYVMRTGAFDPAKASIVHEEVNESGTWRVWVVVEHVGGSIDFVMRGGAFDPAKASVVYKEVNELGMRRVGREGFLNRFM